MIILDYPGGSNLITRVFKIREIALAIVMAEQGSLRSDVRRTHSAIAGFEEGSGHEPRNSGNL